MSATDNEKPAAYSLEPFFALSSDPLCIAGFDGFFKMVNPALCNLLEYSSEELLASPIDSFIHHSDRLLTAEHRQNIRSGQPLLNFENKYVAKSGKTLWFSWTSIPLTHKNLVYAIAKNITHLKMHEDERNLLLTELSNNNQRLKQLNYTTAHDLRLPVSNLLSVFNIIDKSGVKDPEAIELINMLRSAANGLKRTLDIYVDDLQTSTALHVKTEMLQIESVWKYVIQSIESYIKDARAVVSIDLSGFTEVRFNRTYLESIFLNLLSNSIKYAHPKRKPIVSCVTSIVDGKKQMTVTDNGIGFDSIKAEGDVFGLRKSFHQNPDSKGIGLYLVYNHMTNLGGNISVSSTPNVGTTFTLTFKE